MVITLRSVSSKIDSKLDSKECGFIGIQYKWYINKSNRYRDETTLLLLVARARHLEPSACSYRYRPRPCIVFQLH